MSIVRVSLAIITDQEGRVLITRRPFDVFHGGLWEVPGGKIEFNETPFEALVREVYEEIGLHVKTANLINQVEHTYPEKKVCLHVFKVKTYTGEAFCKDGQLDLRWVSRKELSLFDFPEANRAIMALI